MGAPRAARAFLRLRELALQVRGELGDGREVKQLREVHLPGIFAINLLVDLDELERARADLEQIVVDLHPLALERCIADALEPLLDLGTRAGLRSALCGAQGGELLALGIELPVGVTLLQQMTLDLAAGGLG